MVEFDPMELLQHCMRDIQIIEEQSYIGQQITKVQEQINYEKDINQQEDQNEQHLPSSAHIVEIDSLEWEFDLDFLHQNIKQACNREMNLDGEFI